MCTRPAEPGEDKQPERKRIVTRIYCGFADCENFEEGICSAAAVRIDPEENCLTYQPYRSDEQEGRELEGDRLTWDTEYFEDDPSDGETVL